VLHTTRLRLEPLRREHAAVLHERIGDPRCYELLPTSPLSQAELEARYAFLEHGTSTDGQEHWLSWTLFLQGEELPVGTFQASLRDGVGGTLAYMIAPAFWRRGIASEAGHRVIRHLFEHYDCPLLTIEMDVRNVASIKLAESLGFSRMELKRDADYFKGSTSHEYRYELLCNHDH
jgi:ribosomal-protein-alanine N-acetyltransferase